MKFNYVVYDAKGEIIGAYLQELAPDHADNFVRCTESERLNSTIYRVDLNAHALVLKNDAGHDLQSAKKQKHANVNKWREFANYDVFSFAGKFFSCDLLSRSDLSAIAEFVAMNGNLPDSFPGAWKALDNSFFPINSADEFRALHAAMVAQGTANFIKSQQLKALIESAETLDQLEELIF